VESYASVKYKYFPHALFLLYLISFDVRLMHVQMFCRKANRSKCHTGQRKNYFLWFEICCN